ncbi:MAG: indolepyruvate oxidoreductase subunit beta [Candidatus Bathyarchaeota archaeon]|nr:indolepyruvate oxidoreductase subunit beta [Candidatus Bathyarchaeota archaeon]
MKLDIIFSGVGGQGVVVISDIFCEAALIDGFDAAKAEIHGMAQRGGAIGAHVRIGDKVEAPLIESGKADIVVGFEVLETARALPMLKPKGTVVVNTKYLPPNAALACSGKPLSQEQLLSLIRARAGVVHEIDGFAIAKKLGNMLVVNTVLLGALSALPENPVQEASLKKAMASRLKEKHVEVNLNAFQRGKESVKFR